MMKHGRMGMGIRFEVIDSGQAVGDDKPGEPNRTLAAPYPPAVKV
jgi:hypothetical protein